MKKRTLLFIFLSIVLISPGQVNLDSLWSVWNDESSPDSSRALAMYKISWDGYLFSQPDSAFYFAQQLHDFAIKNTLKKEEANALKIQGVSYYIRGDNSNALDYYQQSFKVFKEISDKTGMANTLNNIGLIYENQGNYPEALNHFRQSLTIKEEIGDKNKIAGALNNIGIIFFSQGLYPKALNYFERCLKIYEETSDKRNMVGVLNNIGLIYTEQGDYTRALNYYQQNLRISEGVSDRARMGEALNNIGLIYMNQGVYTQALDYYQQSLKIREDVSDKRGIARTLNNIGSVYMKQGAYLLAMDHYQQSLKIREEILDKRGMALTYNNIGRIRNKQGNHTQAIIWCEKGLYTSEEINVAETQKEACQCLYEAYKALDNNTQALKYHERRNMLDYSLQTGETAKKLQQMEFAKQVLADSLQQEEEKLRVQMAHDEKVRKKNRTRNIYIGLVLFLLIFAIGLRRRMLFIRKAKRAIEKEKDRSDNLLLNILPQEIADELKEKGRAEARNFNSVSILFTDFKGFTQLSEKLSAEELVHEINICFKAFDAICGKYGIEKIKTIGDAFMAAGGLPVPMENSVYNTVLAGLEMTGFIIKRKKEREAIGEPCFEMRVGIHTGPVVAGIVGVTKFQYDVWGDTVNTASRMENSGEVGKVNISRSTFELLKDEPLFEFQSRGKVKTKGKGEIEMWFVEKVS